MPFIPGLGRQRQANLCELKTSLVYRVPGPSGFHSVSNKTKQSKQKKNVKNGWWKHLKSTFYFNRYTPHTMLTTHRHSTNSESTWDLVRDRPFRICFQCPCYPRGILNYVKLPCWHIVRPQSVLLSGDKTMRWVQSENNAVICRRRRVGCFICTKQR